MSGTRNFFGIASSNSFSLKNRFWARLVEKLVMMNCQKITDVKDQDLKGRFSKSACVYKFSNEQGDEIILELGMQEWEEGYFRLVKLFDSNGNVLAEEKIFPDGLTESHSYHPLFELFELVDNANTEKIQKIKIIAQAVNL